MEETSFGLGEPFIDESVLADVLCELSPEFERFYREERQRYDFPIYFEWKPDLDEGNRALTREIRIKTEKIYKICFRNYPRNDDALIFAHEIEHAIRAYNELSLKIESKDEDLSYLAKDLMSMLEDSIVDSILYKNYNFNLLPSYEKGLKRARMQLSNINLPRELSSDFVSAIYLCNQKLRWNLIPNQHLNEEWAEYLDCCKTRLPNTWTMSEILLFFISETAAAHPRRKRRGIQGAAA